MDSTKDLRIGFVGCGTIAASIVSGLAQISFGADDAVSVSHFHISQRSEAKSSALLARFGPSKISVAPDGSNQSILDSSTLIFLCVLPKHVDAVLAELTFDPSRHTLVSLVSTSKVSDLSSKSGLPASRVFKMICLPSVANRSGTCLLTPPSPPLSSLLSLLGGCVPCPTEQILTAMMVPTCMMGPYYKLLDVTVQHLVAQGVQKEAAQYFVARSYAGMAMDAERGCTEEGHFERLIKEQTPGGINEMSIGNLERLGAWDIYKTAMDGILERLEGRGNGRRGEDK